MNHLEEDSVYWILRDYKEDHMMMMGKVGRKGQSLEEIAMSSLLAMLVRHRVQQANILPLID